MRHRSSFVLASVWALIAAPAAAEVTATNDSGFVSRNEVEVPVSPEEAWALMLKPAWWNPDHSYSGSADNMSIEPVAGGCFCETIPGANGAAPGEVEHMRVIYIAPGSTLRMSGGLGPLQSEAVTGVLTMTVEPAPAGSRIVWEHVVGGYMRPSMTEMAPAVDRVVGEQLSRLALAARG